MFPPQSRARAGLAGPDAGLRLLEYRWDSLATAYAISPAQRAPWAEVAPGLQALGFRDTSAGRRGFVERLEGCACAAAATSPSDE